MERFLRWVRRHDLAAFPLITFALGWLFYVPGALVIAGHPERLGWLVFFQTPGACAALVAGVLVRHARGGRAEVKQVWLRYLDWKGRPWWWWLGAIVLMPLLAVLAGLGHGSFGAGLLDLWSRLGGSTLLVLPPILLAQLASSPLVEEYGWRGFWQVRLQYRLPAWAASLLVGLLWGVHHIPIMLVVGADPVRGVVGALGPSVLAAWLLNTGRGSMVGPMLLHAGLNLAMAIIAPNSWWFPLLTLAAAAAVVALFGPKDLGFRPRVSLPPAALDTTPPSAQAL